MPNGSLIFVKFKLNILYIKIENIIYVNQINVLKIKWMHWRWEKYEILKNNIKK